jgi:Membrane protein involved in colicin uptake
MAEEISSSDDLDSTVTMAFRCYRESKRHSSTWRQEAKKWYDLVANKQWDDEDIAAMKDEDRVPVVINRTARAVNAILGTQVNNRQETRFIPRELGDVQVNELLTGAADWVRDGCDAEDEESDAFEDTTICGMGWIETRLDDEIDPELSILMDRIDPLDMYWDPGAKKRNLADAKWIARIRQMPMDEFYARWPDAQANAQVDPWWEAPDDLEERQHVYPNEAYNNEQGSSQASRGRNTIGVMQIQWAERVPMYRVGQAAERITAQAFKKLKKKLDQSGVQYIKQTGIRWRQAFIAGGANLEESDSPFPDGSTYRCITYKRDRNKNTWYGIVAAMMDPQKYGNKFLSLILDILTKSSKGGVMMEKDAVDNPAEVEQKWARTDALIFLRPGGSQKIMPKPEVKLPAGLDRLVAYFLDSVHEVTGINLELLGMANREQAGVLEHQRKQAGVTIIAPLFDGLRRYRKEQGRVLLYFIQTYLSDGRLVRINGTNPQSGKQGEFYAELSKAKLPETSRYDVIVDEAPTSPNMKERVFGMLGELLPTLAKMGVPIPPDILDYAPFPSKLTQVWKEHIAKSGMSPEQIQQLQQQMQKMGEENQQLKQKKEEKMTELQMDQVKAQQDMAIEREKMQLEREKMMVEIEIQKVKLQLEREKAEAQLQIEQRKTEHDLALNQHKTRAELQMAGQKTAGEMELAKRKTEAEAHKTEADAHEKIAGHKDVIEKVFSDHFEKAHRPRKRTVKVVRDAKGELTGAEINE